MDLHPHRHGHPVGQRGDAGLQSAFFQRRRHDAVHQRPQIVEQQPELLAHPLRQRADEGRVTGAAGDALGVDADHHDALLRTVVQVAGDPPPFGVRGDHDAASGLSQPCGGVVPFPHGRPQVDHEALISIARASGAATLPTRPVSAMSVWS